MRIYVLGLRKKIQQATLLLAALLLASSFTFFPVATALPSWSELQLAGNTDTDWNIAAISGNDQYALAANTRLYLIKNNNTFSEIQPAGNNDVSWDAMALSESGRIMLAAGGGKIYKSINFGVIWTEVQPAGNTTLSWRSLTISDNGKIMLAGVLSGRLYRSTDGGATWAETRPAGNADKWWMTLDISADGTTILAGSGSSGRLYRSINSGNTWTETQPAGNSDYDWRVTGIADDGLALFAAARYGRAYVSTNGGSSWTETQPAGNTIAAWTSGGTSNDGHTILVGTDGGRLYTTSNGGSTWSETQPSGAINRYWYALALSDDGGTAVAGAYSNRFYRSGTVGDGVFTPENLNDFNDDGEYDADQPHISGYTSPYTGKTVVIDVGEDCELTVDDMARESSFSVSDAGYNYDNGFFAFEADCFTPGATTTIRLYYYGISKDGLAVRKHNPITNAYFNVSGATLTDVTLNGEAAVMAMYQITDGGVLDVDGVANGEIVDPVGLGSQVVGVPNTGLGGAR